MSGKPRGELVWRAVRYGCAVFAGYLFGLAAGTGLPGSDSPAWPIIVAVAALGLFLVFRQGAKSQSHAAVDAILRAQAHAEATAKAHAVQSVVVAGGHVAHLSDPSASAQLGAPLPASNPAVALPHGEYVDIWSDGQVVRNTSES